jgi:transposase
MQSAIQMLSLNLLPHELVSLSDEFLLGHLREVAKRGAGMARIQRLKAAANRSVGIKQGMELAKMELQLLLAQYELVQCKFDELTQLLLDLLSFSARLYNPL